jgi:hypothetical protein
MKTSELTEAALDWAVARCEGGVGKNQLLGAWYAPSTNWAQGGPIIERENIAIWPDEEGGFFASANEGAGRDYHGSTYLSAAMRCYVASKLGDEIDLPKELI